MSRVGHLIIWVLAAGMGLMSLLLVPWPKNPTDAASVRLAVIEAVVVAPCESAVHRDGDHAHDTDQSSWPGACCHPSCAFGLAVLSAPPGPSQRASVEHPSIKSGRLVKRPLRIERVPRA